jgi:hypothetical protein
MEAVERHVAVCARCRQELEASYASQTLLNAYRDIPSPEPRSGWAELRERLLSEPAVPVTSAEPPAVPRSRPAPTPAGVWALRLRLVGSLVSVGLFGFVCYRMGQVQPVYHAEPSDRANSGPAQRTFLAKRMLTRAALPSVGETSNPPSIAAPSTEPIFETPASVFQTASASDLETTAPRPSLVRRPSAFRRSPRYSLRPRVQELALSDTNFSARQKPASSRSDWREAPASPIKFLPRDPKSEKSLRPSPDGDEKAHYPLEQLMPVSSSQHFVMGSVVPTPSDLDSVY